MFYGAISRRYARAIFELAIEKKMLSKVISDLEQFLEIWKSNKQLQEILTGQATAKEIRKRIINTVSEKLQFNELSKQFLFILDNRRRIDSIELILLTLKSLQNEREGITNLEILSADAIEKDKIENIKKRIESATGKKVSLKVNLNPELLGGIVLKIGDLVIDGSLKTALENIKKNISGELTP